MKSLTKTFGALGALLIINGCDETNPTIIMETEKKNQTNLVLESTQRYDVKRVDVFADDLAYNGKRGIYEIKDRETGKVYLGISGIGITQRGSHQSDDNTVEDER
jgi:hypothetical protein